MEPSTNSHYITTFAIGTLIGATSTYLFVKYRKNTPHHRPNSNSHSKSKIEDCFQFKNKDAETEDEYRIVIGIRTDVKMQKGKVAAQCGHAAVAAYSKASDKIPNKLKKWLKCGGPNITVCVDSEDGLLDLDKKAKAINVLSCIIRDAGHTQVAPGTRTVIALGPARKNVLDQITGHLNLY